jgi:hypothetical protein
MKTLPALLLLAALSPSLASAATLTYEIDLAKSKMDSETAFELCGLPKIMQMDSKEDLATFVIKKTQVVDPKKIEITTIQKNGGSMMGGGIEAPYTGDYRTRVAITKTPGFEGAYPAGIYKRIEVVTYGSPAAPAAFTVDASLLNYRESAELAEDSICSGYAYRLR